MVEVTADRTRPHYRGGMLSQEKLVARRDNLKRKHRESVKRVEELSREQEQLSAELGAELGGISAQAEVLDTLQQAEPDSGLVALLTRAFARRRVILQRRSVAEDLLRRYEATSQSLRRAAAFTDELQRCALEIQQQVDALHREAVDAVQNRTLAAQAVLALEDSIAELEDGTSGDPEKERKLDALRFRQRSETLALELFAASDKLARAELPAARSLRDTVQDLHQEMARFVLGAESAVNATGRQIQALGMAADAHLVVHELKASMADLDEAMAATQRYVAQAQHLLAHVLPDLNAQIETRAAVDGLLLVDDLDAISREKSRDLADRALRDAALAEVEALAE